MEVDAKTEHERPVEPRESPATDLGAQLGRAASDVQTLFERVVALAMLEWKRLRLRAVDRAMGVGALALLVLASAAIAIGAGVLVVSGTRDGLAQLSGEPWVGELGAGVLLLLVIGLGGTLLRGVVRRRLVADAVRDRAPSTTPPASNGKAAEDSAGTEPHR